jgi:Lrp/AsnC family transcriptional regulator for asnA, asnC and gidA
MFMSSSPRRGRRERVRRSSRLDQIQKQIVAALQIDGRLSFREFGRQVGASESAVRNGVARLRRDGVMQIVAVTDPLALGFPHEALVAVRSSSNSDVLADELAAVEALDFVVQACVGTSSFSSR